MYDNSFSCVKVDKVRTDFFKCNLGVRQGDNMSPNLFNLYINDLPNYFDSSCDPVHINNCSVNSLLYADDVVLLSTSEKGLQKCVDRLAEFSRDWKMTVNLKKTKILVFNKAGRKTNIQIKYNDQLLENVKQYKYLGIIFSASGSFSAAKNELYNKGFKAFFKMRKTFDKVAPNAKVMLHIFEHTIKPII